MWYLNKQQTLLNSIYEFDPKLNSYKLKIKVEKYDYLFNGLDPSPLIKRDLDQDVVAYIDDFSDDIPLNYNLEIIIIVPKLSIPSDEPQEERLMACVKAYYAYLSLIDKRKLKKLQYDAILYVVMSMLSLYISYTLDALEYENYFFQMLVEGFNIGGWVLLWEALSLIVFRSREIGKSQKKHERIINAKIRFEQTKN